MLPTAAGGDVMFEGLLMNFIKPEGTVEEFSSLLKQNNISSEVLEPRGGERILLDLKKRAVSGVSG